jgi:hypothetical protein
MARLVVILGGTLCYYALLMLDLTYACINTLH